MQRIAVTDVRVMDRNTQGVREYGAIGLILALGEVVYNDTKRTFQQWHEELKGGLSKYTQEKNKVLQQVRRNDRNLAKSAHEKTK